MQTHTLEIEFDSPDFPATVFALEHRQGRIHGLYEHFGVHGLAVFASAAAALIYSLDLDVPDMAVTELAFDQANDVVKSKPEHVTALIMVDAPEPLVWLVR